MGFIYLVVFVNIFKKISFFNVENEKIETIYWANNSYRWRKKNNNSKYSEASYK